jgi:chromate reductase
MTEITMDDERQVLGFAGSLRTGSYNKSLLRACAKHAPASLEVDIFDLDGIPLYNQDVKDQGDPEDVAELKDRIESSDGLLIVTPEYNHGIPAVTKNAIDWCSKTQDRSESVLAGKPAAVAGATPGGWGTIRSQMQLRQSLNAVGTLTLTKPEVLVANASERFDDGELVDDNTIEFLQTFMESFEDWITRLS